MPSVEHTPSRSPPNSHPRSCAVGDLAQHAAAAFGAGGEHFETVEALIAALPGVPGRTLLVKGSRFMRMERVVQRFINGEPHPYGSH